ncbi:hypothetical protein G6F24_018570 [Rhizopus arrhizus]|nr:hypothetical protein G6F24_018570 [Rhizopus arrhizus]
MRERSPCTQLRSAIPASASAVFWYTAARFDASPADSVEGRVDRSFIGSAPAAHGFWLDPVSPDAPVHL